MNMAESIIEVIVSAVNDALSRSQASVLSATNHKPNILPPAF